MSLQAPVLQITVSEPQSKSRARLKAKWAVAAAFGALLLTTIVVKTVTLGYEVMEKRGAGLLLCSGNKVLLLLRRSKHNDKTWGLPGGNVDATDASLEATALREAQEEMGTVPTFTMRGSLLTRRGKFNNKQYTVFLADVAVDVAAAYVPVLNHEHREWRWFPASEAARLPNLHPIMSTLFSPTLRPQLESLVPALAEASTAAANTAVPAAPVDAETADVPVTLGAQPAATMSSGAGEEAANLSMPAGNGAVVAAESSAESSAGLAPLQRGAGLILVSGDEVLLLKRASKHHDGMWTLPGGHVQGNEKGGADTALREATEEMGEVPVLRILGNVPFRWGKKGDKAFTAVIATLDTQQKASFVPALNKEHSEWRWVPLAEAALMEDLHPVAHQALASSAEVKQLLASLSDRPG